MEKINKLIEIINEMDIKDKLRLAIRMSESNYTNLKFDSKLKELDDEYRTTIINFNKYPTITFAMAKIMEMSKEEQNQVALYLYNNID